MSNIHEYIEAYFQNQLSETEKKQFEERCVQDKNFSEEVALYITLSEGVRQNLLDQKKQQWDPEIQFISRDIKTPGKVFSFRKWVPYAAAACILIAVILTFFNSEETPNRLAGKYIKEHLSLLSATMDVSRDSLQLGISAYNSKEYNKAIQIFEKVYQSDPENSNAKKYIGYVYLVTKNYDKALQQFDELAETKGLYKNPGLFLEALTLLERNEKGDNAKARQLMEKVVKERAEGTREAKKWLQNW